MTRLKLAVVGVGALGRHHARILSGLDAVELVAVAETDPETGNAIARQCGTQWENDYRKLFILNSTQTELNLEGLRKAGWDV